MTDNQLLKDEAVLINPSSGLIKMIAFQADIEVTEELIIFLDTAGRINSSKLQATSPAIAIARDSLDCRAYWLIIEPNRPRTRTILLATVDVVLIAPASGLPRSILLAATVIVAAELIIDLPVFDDPARPAVVDIRPDTMTITVIVIWARHVPTEAPDELFHRRNSYCFPSRA